jgi:hypothetical protein
MIRHTWDKLNQLIKNNKRKLYNNEHIEIETSIINNIIKDLKSRIWSKLNKSFKLWRIQKIYNLKEIKKKVRIKQRWKEEKEKEFEIIVKFRKKVSNFNILGKQKNT